jgi:hypothetical protein
VLEGPCEHEYTQECGIREVLDRIGDKWSVLVVELAAGFAASGNYSGRCPGSHSGC